MYPANQPEKSSGMEAQSTQNFQPGAEVNFELGDPALTGNIGNPALSNDAYDVISIIYHKAKAIQVYEKYLQDVQGDNQLRRLVLQIRHDEERHLEQLKNHLSRLLIQKQPGT